MECREGGREGGIEGGIKGGSGTEREGERGEVGEGEGRYARKEMQRSNEGTMEKGKDLGKKERR